MGMEITNTVSWPTLTGLAAIFAILTAIYKVIYGGGSRAQVIDAGLRKIHDVEDGLNSLKKERSADREADRIKIENQFAALHGGVALLKEQVGEFRTEVTRMYSTKEEAAKIEERLNNALTRLFGHIDTLSKEIRTMNSQIIEAISDRNHAIDVIRKKIEP